MGVTIWLFNIAMENDPTVGGVVVFVLFISWFFFGLCW
jgi:hypothetical protein